MRIGRHATSATTGLLVIEIIIISDGLQQGNCVTPVLTLLSLQDGSGRTRLADPVPGKQASQDYVDA